MPKYLLPFSALMAFAHATAFGSQNELSQQAKANPYQLGFTYQVGASSRNEFLNVQATFGKPRIKMSAGIANLRNSDSSKNAASLKVGTLGLIAKAPMGAQSLEPNFAYIVKPEVLFNKNGYCGSHFLSGIAISHTLKNSWTSAYNVGTLVGLTNTKATDWKTVPVVALSVGMDFDL